MCYEFEIFQNFYLGTNMHQLFDITVVNVFVFFVYKINILIIQVFSIFSFLSVLALITYLNFDLNNLIPTLMWQFCKSKVK